MSGGPETARRAIGAALAGEEAWLVGGATRDRALGRETSDLDVVVAGSPERAARAVAQAAGGAACFELSADFGGWRVAARDGSWQVDVQPLRGGSLRADLALRDFTVNAIAEPVAGGAAVDPLGGREDLAAGRLRLAAPEAFVEDPLRVLRLVRLALELDLEADAETAMAAQRTARGLGSVSGERIFLELRRIVGSPRVLEGLRLMGSLGITAVVLPELEGLRGVEQSRFHHLDVYGHTLEALGRALELEADPAGVLGEETDAEAVGALLGEPLADELTRGEALRWGALLHDVAKPLTRAVGADGRVTFLEHDVRGAELARGALARMRASERLRGHVGALVRHHLRLGFLVHEPQPLARRAVFAYLSLTAPVEVDVTLLSILDRLATRGERARESIEAHMRLARRMLGDALSWRAAGPPAGLWRGDELADALGIATGPRVGRLLGELAAAQYSGEVATREQALAHARAFLAAGASTHDASTRG
ncbi:MAG TPA: HDIG domain-containing protein [Solirubrobacteraceae bacterium]|nr:HDIG domain-containing protein [Solirubrobacteraceae bacterium]